MAADARECCNSHGCSIQAAEDVLEESLEWALPSGSWSSTSGAQRKLRAGLPGATAADIPQPITAASLMAQP
eukprot:363132-Chlamydomonas_euryale.AAC.13